MSSPAGLKPQAEPRAGPAPLADVSGELPVDHDHDPRRHRHRLHGHLHRQYVDAARAGRPRPDRSSTPGWPRRSCSRRSSDSRSAAPGRTAPACARRSWCALPHSACARLSVGSAPSMPALVLARAFQGLAGGGTERGRVRRRGRVPRTGQNPHPVADLRRVGRDRAGHSTARWPDHRTVRLALDLPGEPADLRTGDASGLVGAGRYRADRSVAPYR